MLQLANPLRRAALPWQCLRPGMAWHVWSRGSHAARRAAHLPPAPGRRFVSGLEGRSQVPAALGLPSFWPEMQNAICTTLVLSSSIAWVTVRGEVMNSVPSGDSVPPKPV